MSDGDSTGGKINITKNGSSFKIISSEGIKYPLSLDLNSKYVMKCSKNGFVTKVVYIDTHIPAGREKEDFAKFTATVELFKTDQGKADSEKRVGEIKYSKVDGDFDTIEYK
jgi:hypothetical protein